MEDIHIKDGHMQASLSTGCHNRLSTAMLGVKRRQNGLTRVCRCHLKRLHVCGLDRHGSLSADCLDWHSRLPDGHSFVVAEEQR